MLGLVIHITSQYIQTSFPNTQHPHWRLFIKQETFANCLINKLSKDSFMHHISCRPNFVADYLVGFTLFRIPNGKTTMRSKLYCPGSSLGHHPGITLPQCFSTAPLVPDRQVTCARTLVTFTRTHSQRSYTHSYDTLRNSLSRQIKSARTKNEFKSSLNTFLFEQFRFFLPLSQPNFLTFCILLLRNEYFVKPFETPA